MRQLKLSGLPFTCNCSMIWLWEVYQTLNETGLVLDEARCSDLTVQLTQENMASYKALSPDDMDLLAKMSPDQLVCSDFSAQSVLVIVASSVLAFVLVVLVIVVIAYFRWRQNKYSHQRMGGKLRIKHMKIC